MHRFKFSPDDLFINRLKTYPEYNIFVYQGSMHINRDTKISGSGGLVVYDINRNLTTTGSNGDGTPPGLIRPYLEYSNSEKYSFKKYQHQPLVKNHSGDFQWKTTYVGGIAQHTVVQQVSTFSDLNSVSIGAEPSAITGSYSFESPITRKRTVRTNGSIIDFYDPNTGGVLLSQAITYAAPINITASALQNVAKKYITLSDHFIFSSSSVRSRDLVSGPSPAGINFIFIPSMYYGSTIKKGSVELNYYMTGSKMASCADINNNGELIGTTGSTSGSVVGLVMYDEGIIMLTSSLRLEDVAPAIKYNGNANPAEFSSWQYYGTTLNDGIDPTSTGLTDTSFDLNFKGTNYVNTMTMFAHAQKGHLNHSNNPTYKDLTFTPNPTTGSGIFFNEGESTLANVVSASYKSGSFEKTTYISKVHIYDEDGNLIAITSMAKPVKKSLTDEFTFKMKLDL